MHTDENTISVTGNAIVLRPPDVAYITLYVIAHGILLEDAIQQATNKVETIHQTLKDSFSDIKEIQVQDVYVGESNSYSYGRYDRREPPQPEVIQCLLVIAPPNSDLVTKIVDTASRMGCSIQNPADTRFSSHPLGVVLYGLANYADAEQQVLESAMADAKQNASNTARIVHKQLGAIQKISSVETLRMNLMHDEGNRINRNIVVLPTSYLSVSPKTVEVSARVAVTFALLNEA